MEAVFDILIISNAASICNTARKYCNTMGCFKNVIIARNQMVASRKLLNQKFAVILLDIDMPLDEGFKILNEIDDKTNNKPGAICVVCKTLEKDLIEKIASKKIKHVLVKDLNETQFQQRVLKILNPNI